MPKQSKYACKAAELQDCTACDLDGSHSITIIKSIHICLWLRDRVRRTQHSDSNGEFPELGLDT